MIFILQIILRIIPQSVLKKLLPFDGDVLRSSFAPIRPRIQEYASLFYKNFWEDYPETRPLFGRHMANVELETRINHFMLFIVENADNVRVYLDYVNALAKRHKGYGIRAHQFAYVSDTNVKTLRQLLGGNLSTEVEKEWRTSFTFLTKLMMWSQRFN